MKRLFTFFWILTLATSLTAQTTATFEELDLPANSFANGNDGSGGFHSGNVFLPNSYNSEWDTWAGWAISTATDTLTPGFGNQYSAITGEGAQGSASYAVSYAGPTSTLVLEGPAAGGRVEGLYVTNTTYAYLSMREGDQFAKRFGGETGDDPDFFLLTIKKYQEGELGQDSINIYLADYRFANNGQDYILNDWFYVDLLPLGRADSLLFTLSSSDVGMFGMNTPAYFAIDNLTTLDDAVTPSRDPGAEVSLVLYPNPTTTSFSIQHGSQLSGQVNIFDQQGRLLRRERLRPDAPPIDVSQWPSGSYFVQVVTEAGRYGRVLVKE